MHSPLGLLLLALTAAALTDTSNSDHFAQKQHDPNNHLLPSPVHTILDKKSNDTFFITALTNHPDPPYLARLQCWSLTSSFTIYPTVGKSLALGDVDNLTYVVLPPRSGEGWHRPPHAMFFVLLSGLAQVYVPTTRRDSFFSIPLPLNPQERGVWSGPDQPLPDDEDWESITITPGSPQQVLIAADTDSRAMGHLTFYPGDGETVALQVPFREGVLPDYVLVHEGGCRGDE